MAARKLPGPRSADASAALVVAGRLCAVLDGCCRIAGCVTALGAGCSLC
jgi:hypothetical protein